MGRAAIARSLTEQFQGLATQQEKDQLGSFVDDKGKVDDAKLLAELERDPDGLQQKLGLDDDEFRQFANDLYGQQRKTQEPGRQGGGRNQPAAVQGTQGGALSQQFGDKSKSPADYAEEIRGKNLTHVSGLNPR